MESNFSLDLYLFLKCHSSQMFFYFANQLPGFSIGGTFRLRLGKIKIRSGNIE